MFGQYDQIKYLKNYEIQNLRYLHKLFFLNRTHVEKLSDTKLWQ